MRKVKLRCTVALFGYLALSGKLHSSPSMLRSHHLLKYLMHSYFVDISVFVLNGLASIVVPDGKNLYA